MNHGSLSIGSLCSWAFFPELSDKAVEMGKGHGAQPVCTCAAVAGDRATRRRGTSGPASAGSVAPSGTMNITGLERSHPFAGEN
jgi:hypothetical protein